MVNRMIVKALVVLLSVLLLLGVIGCTGATTPVETAATTAPPVVKPANDVEKALFQKIRENEAEHAAAIYPDTAENRIMQEFLVSRFVQPGRFTLVYHQVSIGFFNYEPGDVEKNREYIKQRFSGKAEGVAGLVDRFFELNGDNRTLEIKSSLDGGYFIDYDQKYDQFLVDTSNGQYAGRNPWAEWVGKNIPDFAGFANLSIPAYDPATGYAVMYGGFTYGGLGGSGDFYLLKYDAGKLTVIYSFQIWIA
jgi:hypothetical protein